MREYAQAVIVEGAARTPEVEVKSKFYQAPIFLLRYNFLPQGIALPADKKQRCLIIPFPKRAERTIPNDSSCPECERLELAYEHAVVEIRELMCTRFSTIGEKVRRLHECQDARSIALQAFYDHKASHYRRPV